MCYLKRAVGGDLLLQPALTGSPSCAVVSNSGALLVHDHGQEIDTHDIVWRFNDAPTEGFESHVGKKHGVRYAGYEGHIAHVSQGERILAPSTEKKKWQGLYPNSPVIQTAGSLDNVSSRIVAGLKVMYPTRAGFHDTYDKQDYGDSKLTSGMTGMLTALANCGLVDAYEIAPSTAANTAKHHYYEGLVPDKNITANENHWHGLFKAEHDLWARLSEGSDEARKQTGKTSYQGFSSLQCPANAATLQSLEGDLLVMRLLTIFGASPYHQHQRAHVGSMEQPLV